jgi:flagellar hook assembly protein FlgD
VFRQLQKEPLIPTHFIPTGAPEANVAIYSSSMDLLYSAHQQQVSRLGQSVFVWNGKTAAGNPVNSGVYIYVVNLGDRIVKGKFALVR